MDALKKIGKLFKKAGKNESKAAAITHHEQEAAATQLTKLKDAAKHLEDAREELARRDYTLAKSDAEDLVDDSLKDIKRDLESLRHEAATLEKESKESGELLKKTKELLVNHFKDATAKENTALAEAEEIDIQELHVLKERLLPLANELQHELQRLEKAVLDLGKDGPGVKHKVDQAHDDFRTSLKKLWDVENQVRSMLQNIEKAVDRAAAENEQLKEKILSFLKERKEKLSYKGGLEEIQKSNIGW
ncbi:MAG: hypothetical protein ACLFO2_01480 [Candidatus Woesearchaeota archaeon]